MSNNNNKPKLVHEYSVDDLLKILSDSTSDDSAEEIKHLTEEDQIENRVVKFLVYYNITPGKYSINIKALYKLFVSWCKDRSIKYPEFERTIRLHLQVKRHKSNYIFSNHVKVNTSLSKITKHIEDTSKKIINSKKNINHIKYIEEFFDLHGLKSGNIYVEADILFYLFGFHNDKKKRAAIPYRTFLNICSLYFSVKQLGFGSTWFGLNESVKNLVTPEWVKVWRQGRVNYGYITQEKSKENKSKLYTSIRKTEKSQKKKILYVETLPEKYSEKQDEVPSVEPSVQSEEQD